MTNEIHVGFFAKKRLDFSRGKRYIPVNRKKGRKLVRNSKNILEVEKLSIRFGATEVVSGASFSVERGKIMALVGESGCGKSMSCLALTRLIQPSPDFSGEVRFASGDREYSMLEIPTKLLRKLRGGGIAYIFQEPSTSLNPVLTVGSQILEAITLHRPEVSDPEAEVIRLLEQVGIPAPESRAKCYPHELSGGMQQRVMIAMALACAPELLVADEPTTALDVTIQAQILELIDRVRKADKMAVILVTHNLGIVAELADSVTVMYAGNVVEQAPAPELFSKPTHPYTRALLKAVPRLGGSGGKLSTIPGTVPSPGKFPPGCRFFGRCERREALPEELRGRCATEKPTMLEVGNGHGCYCHYPVTEEAEK